jgi:hypothetical protein
MSNVITNAGTLAALKAAHQFIVNGTALGFIRMPDAETPDPAHDTLAMIERAIAELEGVQDKRTYLVSYSHARGTGRRFESFNGVPTPESIEALENSIEAETGLSSVGIMSISRIGNSDGGAW